MGAHFWPPDPPCDNPVVCLACCKRRERDAVIAALTADRARIAAAVRNIVFPNVARPAMEEVLRVVEGG